MKDRMTAGLLGLAAAMASPLVAFGGIIYSPYGTNLDGETLRDEIMWLGDARGESGGHHGFSWAREWDISGSPTWDVFQRATYADSFGYSTVEARSFGEIRDDGFRIMMHGSTTVSGSAQADINPWYLRMTFITTTPLPYTVLMGSEGGAGTLALELTEMLHFNDSLAEYQSVFRFGREGAPSNVSGVLQPGLYRLGTGAPEALSDFSGSPWMWMQFGLVPAPSVAVLLTGGMLLTAGSRRRESAGGITDRA